MEVIFVTFAVLNELRLSEVSPLQPENIYAIVVTFAVLNELRSSEVRAVDRQNIYAIVVTFVVLKFFKPVIVVSLGIPRNQLWHEVGRTLANEDSKTTVVILLYIEEL